MSFVMTDEFSESIKKLFQGLVSNGIIAYLSVFIPIFNAINYGPIIKRM